MIVEQIPLLSELSAEEKLTLIEELWEQLSIEEPNIPVNEEHLRILEERRAEYLRNPEAGSTWGEVKKRILQRAHGS